MKSYGLNELRKKYLEFFESKGHLALPSFSLVPENDKSLLLINRTGNSSENTCDNLSEVYPNRRY